MSLQQRRERREGSRFPSQRPRQEWIPKGAGASTTASTTSTAAAAAVTTTTTTTVDQPTSLHSHEKNTYSDGGSSNQGAVVAPTFARHRSNHHVAHRVEREHVAQRTDRDHVAHRVEREHVAHRVEREHVAHRTEREHVGHRVEREHVAHRVEREHVTHRVEREHAAHRVERGRGRSGNMAGRQYGSRDSSLPQLVQEIQEKLTKGTVECMICYDMVRRSAPIWSCSSCYSIFHLNCIKKWARAPTSVDLSAEKNLGFNWRCPGCQSVQHTSSKDIKYVCFCGKSVDPPSDLYLTPHSCGEPCGKPLEKEVFVTEERKDELCPHACVLQCHPGPCPPCKAFAPPRLCPCGKKRIATRCSDRQSDLTCGQRCDKLLDCGRHCCENACHVGPCDPCQVLIEASCFCSKMTQVLFCGEMALKGEFEAEGGVFSCGSNCGHVLGCGNHICREVCHPGSCGECEFLPSRVKTCCCGKTKLEDERKNCVDPIPTCSKVCSKTLHCGVHACKETCHVGECPPCKVLISQKCRCGSTSRTVECYKTTTENQKFTCQKPCGAKKNCGRHRCSEKCCPLSGPNNGLTIPDWDPHFCSMLCGKKLRCGQHVCETLCHSGHCPPCLETIFTDLTCACGMTSIPPPLPCGTMPPLCQLPCSVPQPCGHSGSHSCHFGDCPPCSVPVSKECVGGHVILRNIPCGSNNIKCNNPCGRTRQCGLHACGRSCHSPPCDILPGFVKGLRAPCGQTCGAPRSGCRHMCMALCHPGCPCPDVRCEFPVTITCSCGRISANVPCDVGGNNSNYNADAIFEASIIQKLPVPLQPVDANGQKVPLGQRKLMCDEECAKLERKRVLADAFDITPSLDALHFGENSSFELLSDTFRRDPKWVLAIEERCKILVLGKSKGTTHGLKVHVFCPMIKDKRDAVRMIAERWKLAVNAAGWEPKRFIVISATQKSKTPARVLGVKGTTTLNAPLPTAFDPLVDMDPRLVVSFPDLPRDADISALVLRFGGECELVWLNDRNALAVFHDPARAATAMRRLDHGTVYQGAVSFVQNAGASAASSVTSAWGGTKEGGGLSTLRNNPWKKAAVLDPGWKEDSWGDEQWTTTGDSANIQPSVLMKEAPIPASLNLWNVLNHESSSSSSSATVIRSVASGKQTESGNVSTKVEPSAGGADGGNSDATEAAEVVDDWEKAFE